MGARHTGKLKRAPNLVLSLGKTIQAIYTQIPKWQGEELDQTEAKWEEIAMRGQKLPIKVGILGGGQLARMLALRAHQMGMEPHIMSSEANDPGAQVTSWWTQGDPGNEIALKSFLAKVDVATFESEFFSPEILSQAAKATKTPIFPRPHLMGLLQDRLPQKQLLQSNNIPTAPFIEVNSWEDLLAAHKSLGLPLVLKKRRFGYDGYGTFILKTRAQITKVKEIIESDPWGFVAETYVPFQRELAVMIIRSRNQSLLTLPLVESYQRESKCLWVKGPVHHQAWQNFKRRLVKMLHKLNYVGAIGIELFDTGHQLFVNELAPRVHNSGHYSMDALSSDQFTLHLKAIAGVEFSKVSLLSDGFAMYNLIGTGRTQTRWVLPEGIHLHWYGKSDSRKGRKMGHINCLSDHPEKALQILKEARKGFKI